MAASPSSSATLEIKPETPQPEKLLLQSTQPDPPPSLVSSSSASLPSSSSIVAENPNSNLPLSTTPLPLVHSFAPPSIPPSAPSFRPVTPIPQFSHLQNPNLQNPNLQNPNFQIHNVQNPNVQPPGVNPVSIMLPGAGSGAGAVTVSVSPLGPGGMYQVPPGQLPNPAVRPYGLMPNGFPTSQGMIPPPVS